MVGLSVVLEAQKPKPGSTSSRRTQVLSKATIVINTTKSSLSLHNPSNSSSSREIFPTFLDRCFLCEQKLLPGNDIYMYKGDKGFCSVECRCRQIFMDEEESMQKDYYCSLAAVKPSSSSSRSRKNQTGSFAY